MSFERENALAPEPVRPIDPRFLIAGYVLGLIAMAPSPMVYYWLFAPLGALFAAGVCVIVSMARPAFGDAARGAALAALFGAVVVLVLFFGAGR